MTDYLNFTKIIPPKPNDPDVDVVNQINVNWDLIDTKLQPYIIGGSLTLNEQGQEYFDANFRYAVWSGSSARLPDTIDDAWSAWTAIPVASGKAIRSGFTPKWRNNSLLRMVELSGGFQWDSSANPWTAGALTTLNDDSVGSPPLSMTPIGGYHIAQSATALSAGSTVVSSGYVQIDKPVPNSFVRIRGQYLGGSGGGNFLMLDQVWWWY